MIDRLHSENRDKLTVYEEMKIKREEEEYRASCTFKPKISSKS